MARALELGWESFRAGSLGVGATVGRHGEVIATAGVPRRSLLGACVPDVERIAEVQPT